MSGRSTVAQQLREEGFRFEFSEAVHQIEQLMAPRRAGEVGASGRVDDEPIRFTSRAGLDFPASDVQEIRAPAAGRGYLMTINFLGLAGHHGPLPDHLAETILDRRRSANDTALSEFLDVFNNRLVGLRYRIRRTRSPGMNRGAPADGWFAQFIQRLIGLATPGLRGDRMQVPNRALMRYGGILARPIKTAAGLAAVVGHYFDTQVTVRGFVGGWIPLPRSTRRVLDPAASPRLGVDAVLGERSYDQSKGIHLTLGPLSYAEFGRFLPARQAATRLVDLVKLFCAGRCAGWLDLLIHGSQLPAAKLGSADTLLGWTSVLPGAENGGRTYRVRLALDDLAAAAAADA